MKNILLYGVIAGLIGSVTPNIYAADRVVTFPINDALSMPEAMAKLGGINFYFGPQAVPAIVEELGPATTSQRTNAFAKSDEVACKWVFLSAMIRLQKKAEELGANAVVNIVSNNKHNEFSSEQDFECHVGALMAGVALKGQFVRLKN